jgi:hypothetical protein
LTGRGGRNAHVAGEVGLVEQVGGAQSAGAEEAFKVAQAADVRERSHDCTSSMITGAG